MEKAAICAASILLLWNACGQQGQGPRPRDPQAVEAEGRFLDTLQGSTLRYFLYSTDTVSGLTPDRAPSPSPSSIAATGFALTCLPVAAERNLLSREVAATRVLTTLRFLIALPQNDRPQGSSGYKGFFYHFLDLRNGTRAWRCELSTVDTALLMAGILVCQTYFSRPVPVEASIRALADSLYRRVDWRWAMGDSAGVLLGWSPETGFAPHTWRGYNEAMILYILALGSPTHPVPASVWDHWTSTYRWAEFQGQEFVSFGPLFGHQFSHCWIDFRGIRDRYMDAKGIDYFANSRRATYAQREYARENPLGYRGYSATVWGFSACDGPGDTTFVVDGSLRHFASYAARGVSFDWVHDDGTITPAASGGSVAFAPEICIPALLAMKTTFGTKIWREYGFVDAFNPTFVTNATGPAGWFDSDALGIDQGPIAIMIENLKSNLVWDLMKRNSAVVHGLQAAGFSGGWLPAVRH